MAQELKSMNIEYNHTNNRYINKKPHITLFRCKGLFEDEEFVDVFEAVKGCLKDKKIRCDFFDISTRFQYDEPQFY